MMDDKDEPLFILRGGDSVAPFVVTVWVKLRLMMGDEAHDQHIEIARELSRSMEAWARENGRPVDRAFDMFMKMLAEGAQATQTQPKTWFRKIFEAWR